MLTEDDLLPTEAVHKVGEFATEENPVTQAIVSVFIMFEEAYHQRKDR